MIECMRNAARKEDMKWMSRDVELKPCPFCGHSIVEKDVYDPSKDWSPTFIDPDSGGDPINIHCECGLEFCTGTHDWGEFVKAWNRRANNIIGFQSVIDVQPTAYEPDKVVEQLEDYGNEEMCYYKNTPYEKCIEECINKAIKIVKGGGVDEMEE